MAGLKSRLASELRLVGGVAGHRGGSTNAGLRLLAGFATAGLLAFTVTGGVLARGAGAHVPSCPASAPHTNPHPDCLFRPYAWPKQAATFDGTATVTSQPHRIGSSWNEEFTVVVHYSRPYSTLCSENTAPSSPCITEAPNDAGKFVSSFAIVGDYVPGAKTLQGVTPDVTTSSVCPEASGTCVETFEMNTYSIWGHFDFVVSMGLGYNVPLAWKGEGGVFGGASFEAPISVTFPKLPGSSKVEVLPPA